MNWLIELAAHFAGLSDAQLKQIEAALPTTRKLIDLLIAAQPLLMQAQPMLDEASAELKQISPALNTVLNLIAKNVSDKGTDLPTEVTALQASVNRLSGGS